MLLYPFCLVQAVGSICDAAGCRVAQEADEFRCFFDFLKFDRRNRRFV